jgi:hypothetical protein
VIVSYRDCSTVCSKVRQKLLLNDPGHCYYLAFGPPSEFFSDEKSRAEQLSIRYYGVHLTKHTLSGQPRTSEKFMFCNDGLSSSVVETIAGFTAGTATTLCLHPLDLIKTRLQGTFSPTTFTAHLIPGCTQSTEPHRLESAFLSESSAKSSTMKADSSHFTAV